MRMRSKLTPVGLALVSVLVLARPASAGSCDGISYGRSHWRSGNPAGPTDGYAILKGGGMLLGGESGPTGGYFGLELGRSAGNVLDLGFSLDWFHRRSRDMQLLFESDHGFQPPIRGEITQFESASDFVPIGATLRLRLPLANTAVVPFVSGTLAYEILHLSFYDRDPVPGPYDYLLSNSQTLMGFGWQAAGGVEIAVAPNVGLLGEVGVHRGDPSRQVDYQGGPIDLSAPLHGGFLRLGFRVAL